MTLYSQCRHALSLLHGLFGNVAACKLKLLGSDAWRRHTGIIMGLSVQVCSVLLRQTSPSCQMLCCKAINLLATHILGQDADRSHLDCQVNSWQCVQYPHLISCMRM